MSELLRRGYVAALAPAGAPNCDIVVTDISGDRLHSIQVKTRNNAGRDKGWHMSAKHEKLVSSQLFYCFVDSCADNDSMPFTYVVPSSVVAQTLKLCHSQWLALPGAKGQQRKDSNFRRFLPGYDDLQLPEYHYGWAEKYREAWHQLEMSSV